MVADEIKSPFWCIDGSFGIVLMLFLISVLRSRCVEIGLSLNYALQNLFGNIILNLLRISCT